MACGEDGTVTAIDLREKTSRNLVTVNNFEGNRICLLDIQTNPVADHKFCVSGMDKYVRIFDKRYLHDRSVVKYFCPPKLHLKGIVTSSSYSNNGDAIIVAYENDDIFLFNTASPTNSNPAHRYEGKRTSFIGIGGEICFFPANSELIVGGSRCGSMFIWNRHTEAVVDCLPDDDEF